jgi:thioesterase domain-containing protein
MLDSYPDRRRLLFVQRTRLSWRLAVQRVALLTRVGGHSDRPVLDQKVGNTADRLEADGLTAHALQRVKDAQYRALRDYRPSFYNGKVKFVRAAKRSHFPADPDAVWSHLVRELEVETVPGIHVEMLTTQVETLASVVGRFVEEARGRE